MRFRQALPALAVALAASAAWGPPAVARARRGRGAAAGTPAAASRRDRRQRRRRLRPAGAQAQAQATAARRRASPRSGTGAEHRFPIAGAFDWGAADARFGAGARATATRARTWPRRPGTPVVAPYRGVVTAVAVPGQGRRPLRRDRGRGLRLRLHAPARRLDRRARGRARPHRPAHRRGGQHRRARPVRTSTSSCGRAAGTRAATRSTRCRCCSSGPLSPASG